MKPMCAPCLKALEKGEARLCVRCRRALAQLLAEREEGEKWPPFWVLEPGEAVLVPGMSGMGKSTFEKAWTAHMMEEGVPVYWWDAMREASIHGVPRVHAPLGPLLTQVTVSDLETDPGWLAWVEKGAKAQALAIVPDNKHPSRAERAADFVRAMGLVIRNKPEGDCVLFVAECGLLEGESEAEEVLGEIASSWRKEGVAAVFDTQSAYMVPVRAREQVRTVVAFKQVGSNDRRAVKDLATQRFSDAVKKLPPHRALLADRMDLSAWEGDDNGPEEAGAEEAA
jgi:hypothetical protein